MSELPNPTTLIAFKSRGGSEKEKPGKSRPWIWLVYFQFLETGNVTDNYRLLKSPRPMAALVFVAGGEYNRKFCNRCVSLCKCVR